MTDPQSPDVDDPVRVSELPDGIVLIEACGEIDVSSAPQLQRELLAAVAEADAGVILDISGVTYMDSSGIAAVVAGYAEASARGSQLAVACGEGHVADRMRMMGLDAVLHLVADRQEARERLRRA